MKEDSTPRGDQAPGDKPPKRAFPAYLLSSSLLVAGLSLENLLVSWIFLGVLKESAAVFSQSRALISTPPLFILLIGGIIADRVNARSFLLALTLAMALAPLILAIFTGSLTVWMVLLFGLVMAMLNAFGEPARQAILNRITRANIQSTVAIVVIVPTLFSLASMSVLNLLESVGVVGVLVILSLILAASTACLLALPSMEPVRREQPDFFKGFLVVLKLPLVRDVIAMNFVSALFNAGGYMVAVPLVVTQVYGGDEGLFTLMMIVFMIGSTGSNVLLLMIMPLLRPGQLFVVLQLVRAVILFALVLEPNRWVFLALILCWGLNMGITTTLMRSTVQELAPFADRARILAVMLFSFMLASPLSALILGKVIALSHPLMGLVPGIPLSLLLFFWGFRFSGLWSYESVSVHPEHRAARVRTS